MTSDVLLLDAPSPAAWIETHLAAHLDRHDEESDEPTVTEARWFDRRALLADDAAPIRAMFDRLVADTAVPKPAAATYVAGWLGAAMTGAIGYAFAATGAGFVVDVATPRWHQHEGGWIDRADLGAAIVVVAPGHPWSGLAGVETTGEAAVRARTVSAVVDLLRPVVDRCHRLARVGKAGLWNEVGDGLGTALAYQWSVPASTTAIARVDAALRVPGVPWKARATTRIAPTADGPRYVVQKGGCCLAYTETAPEQRDEHSYCSTCSLRERDVCDAHQLAWYANEAATHS